MEIEFEKHELADAETHFTFTRAKAYDRDGFPLTHPPYDSNTLDGLACLTGNQVMDYHEGYLPSDGNKLFKQTITQSAKQVRGLRYLRFKPYYVKNRGKVNADIWYI